jgi:hypothetical protein
MGMNHLKILLGCYAANMVVMGPEERSSHIPHCGSLKSYTLLDFDIIHSIIDTEVLKPK